MAFLTGFAKRKELRYGTVFPSANLTDFPKLFKITADSDIAAELASGGGIAVTGSDGTTTVPFGLYPSSDLSYGDLILRAKFSPLTAASTGDVMGYLYYDSGGSTTEDKAGVVSNGYVAFLPLEEDPSGSAPQTLNWCTETNTGTSSGSMTSGDLVAGQVGNGIDFDGSDDVITGASLALSGSSYTVEAIAKLASTSQTSKYLLNLLGSGSDHAIIYGFAGGTYETFFSSGATGRLSLNGSIDTGFHQVGWTYDTGTTTITPYYDGAIGAEGAVVSSVAAFTSNPSLRLGDAFAGAGAAIAALIDEVRISSVARSADWLAYAHDDDDDNSNTFSLGPEETEVGSTGVTADASITLDDVISASAGVSLIAGAAAVTLDDVTSTSAAVSPVAGQAGITLDDVTAASAATSIVAGSAAIALDDVTSAAAAVSPVMGAAAITLDDVTSSATGGASGGVAGDLAVTLDDVTSESAGTSLIAAAAAVLLDDVMSLAEAISRIRGTSSVQLDDVTSLSAGTASDIVSLTKADIGWTATRRHHWTASRQLEWTAT